MCSRGLVLLALGCAVVAAGCGSATDTRPAQWSYISTAIIQPSCATANCHSDLSQRSGMNLDDIRNGYYQLVGRYFVLQNRPEDSALMALLRGEGSRRMPPDFPLPEADIDLIGRWIEDGAPWDGPGAAPVVIVPNPGTGN